MQVDVQSDCVYVLVVYESVCIMWVGVCGCECVGVWVCGCGCVGVWVFVCVCVCVCVYKDFK